MPTLWKGICEVLLEIPEMADDPILDIFIACQRAILDGVLIQRPSATDKEFHFQNWFEDRLRSAGATYEKNGRNLYPDFFLLQPQGYEVKGLEFPGRAATYDSNSQLPSGFYNGRTIYYVFGRYPKNAGHEYPVIDLVICHGDFLNAYHDYSHENKSVRGFGSYGDILIRDRKMYVVPTPFALAKGTTGLATLMLPDSFPVDSRLQTVGKLARIESSDLLIAYHFDLGTNTLTPSYHANPSAGTLHKFSAYRMAGMSQQQVTLAEAQPDKPDSIPAEEEEASG